MSSKEKLIRKLRQLPDDILQEVYDLDIIILRGHLQWNSFLAHQYKKQRQLSHNKNWLAFKFGDWAIQMEAEDSNEFL